MYDDKLLLTVEEAAKRLSVGRSHLYKFIQSGQIKSITIGRSRRIPVSALREFVAERLQEAEIGG